MTKFKVGDRVRLLRSASIHRAGSFVNISEIDIDDNECPIAVEGRCGNYWLSTSDFELVSSTPDEFTQLQARVKELEALLTRNRMRFEDLEFRSGEMEGALRAQLTEAHRELKELKSPQLVSQTYQAVTLNSLVCCPGSTRAEANYEADGVIVGYLVRRDFRNPDGTTKVEAVLEPVEIEK